MSAIKTKFKTTKGKEFDVAAAFPMTLGYIEDLEDAGIDVSKLDSKKALSQKQAFSLFKVTLRQCGLSNDEAREVSTSDMAAISAAIQHFWKKSEVESQGRPS